MKARFLLIIVFLFGTSNLLLAQNKLHPYGKGDFRLDIKLPHFNYVSFEPNYEFRESRFGFNGYGVGFEYNYKERKFIAVNGSIALASKLPIPVHVDREYNKILSSSYFNLTDNIIKNRFTLGYGLNYSMNTWKEWTRDFDQPGLPTELNRTLINNNLGLIFNSYYRVGKTLHLGFIYQPSLLNINEGPKPIYEHLISLEVNWRIKLNKGTRQPD